MSMEHHAVTSAGPVLVLFDIAGTLVGDTGLTMGAYRAVLEDEGMPFDGEWLRDRIGCQKIAVFAELLRAHGRDDEVAGRLADRFASWINASIRRDPPPVLPGVHEAFSILHDRGCGIGLITGLKNVSTFTLCPTGSLFLKSIFRLVQTVATRGSKRHFILSTTTEASKVSLYEG